MPITQELTLPTEEETFTSQTLGYVNQIQYEPLPNDPGLGWSIGDVTQTVEPENAPDVDESRKSTPGPMEDVMLLKLLNQAATLKDLASLVTSSYAARDVYELRKPAIIWEHLFKFLGPDGINDLLMCAYLDGECSYFRPGDGEPLDPSMVSWAAGKLHRPEAAVPDEDVVERMLWLFLDMAKIVNRFLAQMYCAKSVWGQFHGGTLFEMYQQIGFQSI